MHLSVVLAFVATAIAVRVPVETETFNLVNESSSAPSLPEDSQTLTAVEQSQPDVSTALPLAGQYFLVLTCTFVLLGVVLYAVNQFKYFSGKLLAEAVPEGDSEKGPATEEKPKSTFDLVFNETTVANARSAMIFTPVVCTLMLYLMFRAVGDGYNTESTDYQTFQVGMGLTVIGVLLQTLDAFSIRVESEIFGNLSESMGTICIYSGLGIFIWALFALRPDGVEVSVPSKLLAALVVLLLGTMLLMKVMELKKRYVDTRSPVNLQLVNDLFDDNRLEQIRQTASSAPLLMIILFYVNFRFYQPETLPYYIEVGFTGAVIGIGFQAFVVFSKPIFVESAGRVLRGIAIFGTNIFFLIGMIALLQEDWPGQSLAISHALVLLFAIAILMIEIAVLQETSEFLLTTEFAEGYRENLAKITTASQSMMGTVGFGQIIVLMLLFLHFNAELIQRRGSVDLFIQNQDGLQTFIYFVTVSIFTQMAFQMVEAVTGPQSMLSSLVIIAILILNIGLVGIIYYIVR